MIVKVRNKNEYPYHETFKGDKIHIAPGEAVEMDKWEAIQFLGTFPGMELDADGKQKPESYKWLEIEYPKDTVEAEPLDITCNRCGFKARSQWELDGHTAALHMGDLVDPEEAVEAVKKRGRPPKGSK